MNLSTWLADWLTLHRAEVRPRTYESYSDLISRYVVPCIGDVPVADLRPDNIRHLLAGIVAKGHTRTAELVFVMLKCALSDLDHDPMRNVKRPKHTQQRPVPWNDDHMVKYLSACRSHRHGLALSLGLLLGLRRGEICGLRWKDIDLTAGTVSIVNQRIRLDDGSIIDAPPKSATSEREIPIPPQLLPMLRRARGLPDAYLCPLTPSGLDQAHRALVKALELPPLPLHGLRHTMASSALRHGGEMRAIQSLLGHASFSTTANIYAHPDRAMLLSSLDAALRPCYTVLRL